MPQRAHSLAKTVLFNLIFVLLFAVALFWSLFTAYGYRIDPINRQVIQSGLLNLQNTTRNADIYLDNSLEKQKTPCTLNNLSIAPHLLKLELRGYYPWSKNIAVKRDLVTDVGQVKLIPEITDDSVKAYARSDIFAVSHDGHVAIYNRSNSQIAIYDSFAKPIAQTESPRNDINNIFWQNNKLYAEQTSGRIWELRSDSVWQSSSLQKSIVKSLALSPDYAQELVVKKNEIWLTNLQTEKSVLFSRFSSTVDWADWYSATQLIYATNGEIRICDLDQANCYKITNYDAKTKPSLENDTLYFISDGALHSIVLNNSEIGFLGIF